MHQECAKRKKASVIEVIIIVIILFSIMLGINILVYRINIGKIYGDLLTILCSFIIFSYVMKGYSVIYKYTLICEEFIIKQVKGSREKILIDININQIKTIKKGRLSRKEKRAYQSVKKYVNNFGWKCNRYYCIYIENENEHYFEFEPSDKLLEKMMRNNQ